jgi:hypothetical protein
MQQLALHRPLTYDTSASARRALTTAGATVLFVGVDAAATLESVDTVTVDVPPAPFAAAPFLSVILHQAPSTYLCWGVVPTALLGTPTGAVLRRADCTHPRLLAWGHMRPGPAEAPSYDADSITPPPTAYTLAQVCYLLRQRWRMYQHVVRGTVPAFARDSDHPDTEGELPFAVEEHGGSHWYPVDSLARAWDALSFQLMAAAVALRDGVDRGVLPNHERVRGKFAWAERRLALLRLAYGPMSPRSLLGGGVANADGTIGCPWEEHLVLFKAHGLSGYGRVDSGQLCLPPALWTEAALKRVGRTAEAAVDRLAPATPAAALVELQPVLAEFNRLLWDWRTDEAAPATAAPAVERAAVVVAAIPDLEDLHKVAPACMRELAARAFNPMVREHLTYDQRGVFYRFALANKVNVDRFGQLLAEKFAGRALPGGDANYVRKTIWGEIKTNQTFIAKAGASFQGDGCQRIQMMGCCPFFKGENRGARVGCHQAMEAVIRRKAPDDWPQGTPLRVAQFTRAALVAVMLTD